MAASTAVVVRRRSPTPPEAPTLTATIRRRGRGPHRAGAIGLKQIGFGVAGAAASAAVTAGLVTWLGMRPWVAGLTTGGIGAVSAVALDGPIMRPFAAGAALGGGAVAVTSALIPVKKAPAKEQKGDEAPKQLPAGATPAQQRQAGSVSDQMRMQIRQAMRDSQR